MNHQALSDIRESIISFPKALLGFIAIASNLEDEWWQKIEKNKLIYLLSLLVAVTFKNIKLTLREVFTDSFAPDH